MYAKGFEMLKAAVVRQACSDYLDFLKIDYQSTQAKP